MFECGLEVDLRTNIRNAQKEKTFDQRLFSIIDVRLGPTTISRGAAFLASLSVPDEETHRSQKPGLTPLERVHAWHSLLCVSYVQLQLLWPLLWLAVELPPSYVPRPFLPAPVRGVSLLPTAAGSLLQMYRLLPLAT